MTIYCPICDSNSPASQERLREIALLGLARFLSVAHEARVSITPDQQREILDALLTWDPAGLPGAVDWLVHEHADRAAHYAVIGLDANERLVEAATAMPHWDANAYSGPHWDCEAERRVAEQLEYLSADEN
jgi:hypothetical protein